MTNSSYGAYVDYMKRKRRTSKRVENSIANISGTKDFKIQLQILVKHFFYTLLEHMMFR